MRTTVTMTALVAAAAIGVGACKTLDAPDQNAATLQDLISNPTRASIAAAAQGLMSGARTAGPCTGNCAYIGREGMNLDPSNPQGSPNTYLIGTDFAVWANPYTNDKLANIVIKGLDAVVGMTDAEKSAVRGYAKTFKAVDLMYVIQTTDATGAVLDVPENPTDSLSPIATKAATYTRILQLLDDGYADLGTAGSTAFPFTLPAGFTGFTTPATFRFFNRAIKARVDVYIGNYTTAINNDIPAATSGGPFSAGPTTLAQLTTGAFYSYSTNSGDATNGVFDATDRQRFAHNSLAAEAQLQLGATPGDTTKRDDRFLRKVRPSATTGNLYGFDRFWAFKIYNSQSDPIAVIRDEELILLRAEAYLGCTGVAPTPNCGGNRVLALADINTIRTVSGKLAPLGADPGLGGTKTGDLLLDELLYNKRYSLVWEGGYSWFDARKYGVLDKLNKGQSLGQTKKATVNGVLVDVPVENGPAGQVVFQYARLADNECNARAITINATAAGNGGLCQLAAGK